KCRQYGKSGDQRWDDNGHRQRHLEVLPERFDSWVVKLMVKAHRNGKQDEQNKRQAGERAAEDFSSDYLRDVDVPVNVRRQQPEVHEGMPEVPEKGAAERDVDAVDPAK